MCVCAKVLEKCIVSCYNALSLNLLFEGSTQEEEDI